MAVLKVVNEDGGEAAHHATAHLQEWNYEEGTWAYSRKAVSGLRIILSDQWGLRHA